MTIKKSALGKGLGALLDTSAAEGAIRNPVEQSIHATGPAPGSVTQIALDQIEANPFQPRTEFDE